MARTKKTVKPEEKLEGLGDFSQFLDKVEQPIITSITLSQTGTIYGLADNKIYFYDDIERVWRAL